MTNDNLIRNHPVWRSLRWAVWGGAAFLLLLPAIAMRLTSEVDWTALDFIVMGLMLGSVGGAFEIAVRIARSHAYVVAAGIAVVGAFLMTWANLAVGIIGDEDNPLNLLFFGVLAIGFIAMLVARLEPRGMARAMEITAVAQGVACVVTLVVAGVYIFVLTGFFLALWLLSAQLFRRAARATGGGMAA